jgi:nitrite reductase/ring-hydroxylating ferredoxin subunit
LKLVGRVPRARIEHGEMVRLSYPPWDVLVAMVGGEPCAIEDACNHAGGSLCAGSRDADIVACPLHGYLFALRTGELVAPKGLCDNQRRFTTTLEGIDVVVWDPLEVKILR